MEHEEVTRRTGTGFGAGAGRVIFGLLLLWVGVLFFLDQADLIESEPYWRYWPVALIAFGIVKVLTPGGRAFGVFATLIGVAFLLDTLKVWDFSFTLIWPSFLIFAGAMLLWRGLRPRLPGASVDSGEVTHAFAMLGGSVHRVTSQSFRGGDATAVLGGVEIDLTRADLRGEAVLDTFAMWGGVEVKVPESWTVIIRGTPILGAVEDSRRPGVASDPEKRLVIRGTAIMGGVEVKS